MIPLDRPLDLDSPEAPAFLEGLQGNILKSHGRDCTAHLFIRFGPDVAAARAWIAAMAGTLVTSAARQNAQSARWKNAGGAGDLFVSLLLSHDGYVRLGVVADAIPREPGGTYFERGMKRQAEAERPFNDPPSEQWEAPFQGEIHALVILAHDDPYQLARSVTKITAEVTAIGATAWVEPGQRLTFAFPNGRLTIEHFGYEDGISNPVLIQQDAARENEQRGSDQWDATAPLSLVLAPEPGHPDRLGSFFVFRKLEQNVRSFKAALADLGEQLGPDASGIEPRERAGAMAVGRFRDGTPVVPTTAPVPGSKLNNFNFAAGDPNGAICPFQAHIRKTNPRGDSPLGIEGEKRFRVARRGITYGARPDLEAGSTLPPPEQGVGLLFMCYQARLEQFAIQQEGSDSNDFARPGVGVDAVIGQNAAPAPQEWPIGGGVRFTMANFVKMLGGEYFFAPSIAFLRELG